MKKLKRMKNACAILALCYCAQVPEDTAIRICRACGFNEEQGMSDEDIIAAAKQLNLPIRSVLDVPLGVPGTRVCKFIKENKEGLFLARTHDHLFVIDNGLIVDPRIEGASSRRLLRGVWRIQKA